MPFIRSLVLVLALTLAAGCGDDDAPADDHHEFEDISFTQQGLQPDPLADRRLEARGKGPYLPRQPMALVQWTNGHPLIGALTVLIQ